MTVAERIYKSKDRVEKAFFECLDWKVIRFSGVTYARFVFVDGSAIGYRKYTGDSPSLWSIEK